MVFERIAEEKIREAIDQGKFDNLAGAGRPLRTHDDEFAGEDWVGLHVLRSNGFLPEWLELRKQVHAERDLVKQTMADWEQELARSGSRFAPLALHAGEIYRRNATAINAKIDLHNIRCPSFHLEIARFREDALPANWNDYR